MTIFRVIVAILVIGATVALFRWIGRSLGGELDTPTFALLGGAIAALALTLFHFLYGTSERTFHWVGAGFNSAAVAVAGLFLADHPRLWLMLVIMNFPVYLFIARAWFDDEDDFLFSLGNAIKGEGIPQTKEEGEAGLKGLLYLIFCASLVTAEYKLAAYLGAST